MEHLPVIVKSWHAAAGSLSGLQSCLQDKQYHENEWYEDAALTISKIAAIRALAMLYASRATWMTNAVKILMHPRGSVILGRLAAELKHTPMLTGVTVITCK